MFLEDNNFSDIPALGDVQGLENFLNNETLANAGVTPTQPQAQPTAQPQPATQQTGTTNTQSVVPNTTTPTADGSTITLTRDQLNALLASRAAQPQPQTQPQTQPAQQNTGYTSQEQQFIVNALAKGYNLTQINDFLTKQRNGNPEINQQIEKRIAQVEQYLHTQEYKAAESAFISKLTDFGTKWGLSEQDLVTFGNEALKHGINIASDNINLETVFRAVYPEQYAIRSRRMTPTTSSQIYGGSSIPESNRATASKVEDAYVDAFLKGAMPNQYAAFHKK